MRGRQRRADVPDVAHGGRAQDRREESDVRVERRGASERKVRGGGGAGGHDRVDGADHAGSHVVPGVGSAVGPPVPAAGQVLQDQAVVRGGLLAVQRHVQGGHAAVQREGPGDVPEDQRVQPADDVTGNGSAHPPSQALDRRHPLTRVLHVAVVRPDDVDDYDRQSYDRDLGTPGQRFVLSAFFLDINYLLVERPLVFLP